MNAIKKLDEWREGGGHPPPGSAIAADPGLGMRTAGAYLLTSSKLSEDWNKHKNDDSNIEQNYPFLGTRVICRLRF